MNITKTDIETWGKLNDFLYGRAKEIIDVIKTHKLDKSLRWVESIDNIQIDNEHNTIDAYLTYYCMGEYDRDYYLGLPIEWFESDCDYKTKIFEKYNYTPNDDEE